DEVVEEPDTAEADHEEQRQQAGGVRAAAAAAHDDHVRAQVADYGRADDRDATHRRGAALDQVGLRAVSANLLTETAAPEEGDHQRGTQDRGEQRDDGCDQDRLHAVPPPDPSRSVPRSRAASVAAPPGESSAIASATRSRLAAREALTSTTSEGVS